jgi:HTH-type transcriptional regulator, competence development regulator
MTTLGKSLTSARERKGLSLREAERGTGISNAYLSQIENGKISSPSPNVLHKLAAFYGLSYAALMQEAGYPSSESGFAGGEGVRIAARLGPTSPEEEEALAEYLAFMRSRATRQR